MFQVIKILVFGSVGYGFFLGFERSAFVATTTRAVVVAIFLISIYYIIYTNILWFKTNMEKAKIFINGHSQAVRLPKKYRFDVKEVKVIQLGKSIVLSPISEGWQQVFNNISIIPNNDFLQKRDDKKPQERKYFK